MDSIDLNISNYSFSELQELLSLTGSSYTYQTIQKQKNDLQIKILHDIKISNESRDEITKFIESVALVIEEQLDSKEPTKPTTFSDMKQNTKDVSGHFIIENPNNIDRYSQPSTSGIVVNDGAPPGIINPIKYKTIKRAINIDTKFRSNYYATNSTDVHWDLPERIDNVVNMTVVAMELPLSFYTFRSALGNTDFTIQYEYNNISGDPISNIIKIELPDGNYKVAFTQAVGAKSIETAINEALRAKIVGNDPMNPLHPLLINLRYTIDHNSCKSIFVMDETFDNSNESAPEYNLVNWKVLFNEFEASLTMPLNLRLGWLLGFRTAVYSMIIGLNNPGSCVSEGICYPTGPNYIYLSIEDYCNNSTNYFKAIYNDSINSNNIITRINLASSVAGNGIYLVGGNETLSTSMGISRNYFGPVNIQKLKVTLYDEYGRIVVLNNMDWSLELLFECVYS